MSSGHIKGLGQVLAERLVAHFGDDTLAILDEDISRISEVPGIGEKKLEEITADWKARESIRHILLFFEEHHIPAGLATRIHRRYGDQAIQVVRENPYILSRDIYRVGFRTADKIALRLGLDKKLDSQTGRRPRSFSASRYRKRALFLPKEELLTQAHTLLQLEDSERLKAALSESGLRGDVIIERGRCYLPLLYKEETELARSLSERLSDTTAPRPEITEDIIAAASQKSYSVHTKNGVATVIRLSDQQQEAIRLAAASKILVITGGPGCGKTTVLKTLTQTFQRANLTIKLAAPTGRAAQRMAEVCRLEASTIHRLLKFDPASGEFVYCAEKQLELDALIVDESSMIDLSLAHSLIRAIPAEARIVIVGDADQLPSVGAGRVLSDLLAVPEVPRVVLTNLFRRSEHSIITGIAHQINSGSTPLIPAPDGKTKSDAYFLKARETEDAAALIEKLLVEQIPKKFGDFSADIAVLTPMNKGPVGVIELNRRLQRRLVPAQAGLPSVTVGEKEFRLGDRVCQRVNNYNLHEAGVFNGDQGVIVGIEKANKKVFVKLWDGREIEYPSEMLYQLDLAYALSIHRSQGSEIPAVIVVLHQTHSIMLERQLVYTGVTRAKKLLIVVGTRKALQLAARRNHSVQRHTALVERMIERLEA